MIKTYIRVELSSEGESPKQIIERMRRMGAVPVVGDYDFEMDLDDDERLFDKLEEIHLALKGSNVSQPVPMPKLHPWPGPGTRSRTTWTRSRSS
jgi:hypothetical protein